jgi:hypothetical protein
MIPLRLGEIDSATLVRGVGAGHERCQRGLKGPPNGTRER